MNRLEQRGHELLAFNAVQKGTKIDEKYQPIMDDKVVHEECFTSFDRFLFPVKQKKIECIIKNRIKINDFDIVHSHTFFNGGWAAKNLSRKTGIPFVVTVRNTDLNVFLKMPGFISVAHRIAEAAAGILFLSKPYMDAFLDKCYPGNVKRRTDIERKCRVITNGLESFWLENKGCAKEVDSKSVKLICVGKIDKNKNMSTVLKAIKHLKADGIDASMTVIGQTVDSHVKEELENDKDTTMIPYLTKEKLIDYYRTSDIFIMPSFTESFGRVYAEAMSQGLPVVYSRGQGFDGIFPEGRVGYSVTPDDVEEIVSAVKKIMQNYHCISENCIVESDKFDWDRITIQLEAFYKDAIRSC